MDLSLVDLEFTYFICVKLLYYLVVGSGVADKGILNYYATKNFFGAFKYDRNNPAARFNK